MGKPLLTRNALLRANHENFGHPGLVFDKIHAIRNSNGSTVTLDSAQPLIHEIRTSLLNMKNLYRTWFERVPEKRPGAALNVFFRELSMGLGASGARDIGFLFHHTYGTPYIPGSSIKGAVAHYCRTVHGGRPDGAHFRTDGWLYRKIFGSQENFAELKNELMNPSECQGSIIFHDAFLIPDQQPANANMALLDCPPFEDCIKLDVMTPHNTKYFAQKCAPNGMEDPVPVYFFRTSGWFLFHVSVLPINDADAANVEQIALRFLAETLITYGLGSKKSSGYGIAWALNSPDGRIQWEWEAANRADPSKSSGAQSNSAHSYESLRVHDRLKVRRVPDPTGKGRNWCASVDSPYVSGRMPDSIVGQYGDGEEFELEIGALLKNNTVNWKPVSEDSKSGTNGTNMRK